MKRRDFLTVAGVGAGTIFAGSTSRVMAADKTKEARSQIWKCQKCGSIVEIVVPASRHRWSIAANQ